MMRYMDVSVLGLWKSVGTTPSRHVNGVTVAIMVVVVLLSTFDVGHTALAVQSGGVNSQGAGEFYSCR